MNTWQKSSMDNPVERAEEKKRDKYVPLIFVVALLAGAAVFFISLFTGAAGISPKEVLDWLTGAEISETSAGILTHVRLPRIAASFMCGSALALSGLLLQAALNNVLAAPGIIGINGGAGFFVVLASALFPAAYALKMPAAFLGALVAALLVYGIAFVTGRSKTTIIMTGVAISSLFAGGVDLIVTLRPESVMDRMAFYIGGFSGVTMQDFWLPVPWILACFILCMFLVRGLDVMQLGDEVAGALGLHVQRHRLLTILCAAVLAGSAVCVCGLLGFVGLIVPHLMRMLLGMEYKKLVPFTILCGGSFLMFCDMLSRAIFAPYELPVGILLSFLGAPFFLYLLLSRKRRLEI